MRWETDVAGRIPTTAHNTHREGDGVADQLHGLARKQDGGPEQGGSQRGRQHDRPHVQRRAGGGDGTDADGHAQRHDKQQEQATNHMQRLVRRGSSSGTHTRRRRRRRGRRQRVGRGRRSGTAAFPTACTSTGAHPAGAAAHHKRPHLSHGGASAAVTRQRWLQQRRPLHWGGCARGRQGVGARGVNEVVPCWSWCVSARPVSPAGVRHRRREAVTSMHHLQQLR